MKKIIKIIKILSIAFVFLASLACTLPFLAGDATGEETEEVVTPEVATPEVDEITDGSDPCLVGTWTMDTYALNNKFLDLTSSPVMSVVAPSAMTLVFSAEGTYAISGETTIRADIPGTSDYMQMTGSHSGQGSYSADGSSLNLTDSAYSIAFGTMTSSIDGEITEAPGSAFGFPENFMSPPAMADYQCGANALLITYASPNGTITEEWSR